MKLNYDNIWRDSSQWKNKNVNLPLFNYNEVKENTYQNPKWIHFGAGNIFRALQCNLQQKMLNEGYDDTGIIVAEGYDYEIIDKIYTPTDNNGLLVTLKVNGKTEMTVISSVTESLKIDQESLSDFSRLKEIFEAESLQMLSFTITEKGYIVKNNNGDFYSDIEKDINNEIAFANTYMGKLVSLMHHRFMNGAHPIALVSMDNVSHNGDHLKDAVLSLANGWLSNGLVTPDFLEYLENPSCVTYPWTMIDKITPRPDKSVEDSLLKLGFDSSPLITTKGTHIAPFVNAEEAEYLVIEDDFPNGRPSLEKVGVLFTDRETVDKVETMKVTTCLNPLHTTLAIFGCLLGYSKISDEMKDTDLVKLISKIGYDEALPVVVDPIIINPKEFIDEVINVRFPNPFMPDTPQRIATDTSQKISIRFLETIKAYDKHEEKSVDQLQLIPLVIAGWIRYLMGVDDEGKPFEISPDPMLEVLRPIVSEIELSQDKNYSEQVKLILQNKDIFSVDLYNIGIGSKIENYFTMLVSEKGAVRKTIQKCTRI